VLDHEAQLNQPEDIIADGLSHPLQSVELGAIYRHCRERLFGQRSDANLAHDPAATAAQIRAGRSDHGRDGFGLYRRQNLAVLFELALDPCRPVSSGACGLNEAAEVCSAPIEQLRV
jgi:hypothetical protein